MSTNTCEVCGQPSGAGLNRVGGADVCDRCYLGDAPNRIRERGWSFQIRQYTERYGRDDDEIQYCTEATLVLPKAPGVQFKSRRKTALWLILGLIKPGVKSGDSLFDRHVHVRSRTPRAARVLLGDEGVQSILLDMLGEGSWVDVDHGTIEVFSRRPEYVPEAKFSSEICVLASHISRLSAES